LADLAPFRAEGVLQSYVFSGGSGRDEIYQKQASEAFVLDLNRHCTRHLCPWLKI
jgi:hypothetical protein